MLSQAILFAIAGGRLSGLGRSPFSLPEYVLLFAGEGAFSSGLRRRLTSARLVDSPDT